jgi:hypothetical protein
VHQQGSALKLLAAPQARENAALVGMTEPSKKDEIWRWKRRVKSCCERLMPALRWNPYSLKQADAVEAAIDDELIALRVGPFL